MKRTLPGTLARYLLALCTLGGLAFAWALTGPYSSNASPGQPPKPENGWRLLEPVSYENITIFPVVSAVEQDTKAFLTLDEGLASGDVLISEQGGEGMIRRRDSRPVSIQEDADGPSVNGLVLINRSKRPLLLLAGELVSGGKQDRIIAKDRIVPPGGDPLPINVFCVEHGRWSAGSQFSAAQTMVHPSVREQAAVKQDQREVWAAVSSGTMAAASEAAPAARLNSRAIRDAISSNAPTQSYAKIYKESKVGASVEGFVEEMQKRFARGTSGLKGERVVGVVVAYGGEVAWSDIFASGPLFQQYWGKLLRSYAVEALARPSLRERASLKDAREFLRRPAGHEREESEPGVYRLREITEGRLLLIELEALQPKPLMLHRLLLHRTS